MGQISTMEVMASACTIECLGFGGYFGALKKSQACRQIPERTNCETQEVEVGGSNLEFYMESPNLNITAAAYIYEPICCLDVLHQLKVTSGYEFYFILCAVLISLVCYRFTLKQGYHPCKSNH